MYLESAEDVDNYAGIFDQLRACALGPSEIRTRIAQISKELESTEAVPATVKGRSAARQIMYGDDWRASLTVDIGSGRYLYVERYSPGHVVSERDLGDQAREVTEQVLVNLEKNGTGGD